MRGWKTLGLAMMVGGLGLGLGVKHAKAAGPRGMSLLQVAPTIGSDRIFHVEGTELSPAWQPFGGAYFQYLSDSVVFVPRQTGVRESVVSSLSVLHLGAGVGLGSWVDWEVGIPLILDSRGQTRFFPEVGGGGLGDLATRFRFRLWGRDKGDEGFGLGASLAATFPTGEPEAGTGDGGYTIVPKLNASYQVGWFLAALNVGARVRTEVGAYENLDFWHELVFGVGVQMRIIEPLALGMEVTGAATLNNFFQERSETPLEFLVGLKGRLLQGLHVEVGAGSGIMRGYGVPGYRIFVGLQWAPWNAEADVAMMGGELPAPPPPAPAEETVEPELECVPPPPGVPTVMGEYGCPLADRDGDGIPDVLDLCPDEPGYKSEDGCPD